MSMQYPGQVEFACVEGFQISEETVSHCRGDGEWETGVTCTGKLSILCQQYPGQVEFACVEGFQISEETVSHCRGDGQWETGVTCAGKLSM